MSLKIQEMSVGIAFKKDVQHSYFDISMKLNYTHTHTHTHTHTVSLSLSLSNMGNT